jgi:GT2 family glycosyltransferase
MTVHEVQSIDLVVPTLGRTAELGRLLDSVATQTWQGEIRVIVVDQNPDDRVAEILACHGARVSVLHLRSGPGVSRACNAGLREATADLIVRADDDCWYPPDVLAHVVNVLEQQPGWSAVSGICCDEDGHPTQIRWDRVPGLVDRENVFRRVCGVTVFMRRSLVEAIGGCDESYGPRLHPDGTTSGGSEDGEYVLRAITAGFTIGFDPTIRVFHADFRPAFGDRRSMRKAYAYGVDHSRLLRQYGFSTPYAGWRSAQLLAGAAMFLAQGEPGTARFYAAMARGRLRGMLSRRSATEPPSHGSL